MSDQITISLPDGSAREYAAGTTPGTWRRRSASASPRPPSRRRSTARSSTSSGRCPTTTGSPSSPTTPRPAATCCATRRPTSWPRPSPSCSRAPSTRSARRSRTASTTTSSCPAAARSATTTWPPSRPGCARSSPPTSRSRAPRSRADEALEVFADQPYKVEIIERVERPPAHDDARQRRGRRPATRSACTATRPSSSTCARARTSRRPVASGTSSCSGSSGAYWRGNEKGPMLQRIYGTAWESDAALKAHLEQLVEAEKRDHRRLATDLDLLSFPSELGGGLAVWHPKGAIVRKLMEDYSRQRHQDGGYEFVFTPHLTKAAAVRDQRPPRLVRRRHVPADGDGQRHVLHEADELPDALPDLPVAAAQLPGAPAAAVRARHRVPLRAGRHAARADAHPRLHPGRQPHLLHARAGARRDRLAARLRAVGAAGVRVRGLHVQPVDEGPGQVRRRRRGLGGRDRRRCARPSSATAWSTRSRRATPPSTARRSTSTCATPSAAAGSCRRSSTTSTTPSASSSSTSAPTTPGTARSCCTGPCSARSSASSACCSSTTPATCRRGCRPSRCACCPVATAHEEYADKVADASAPSAGGSTSSAPPSSSASASARPSWRSCRTSSSSATTTSPPAPSASTPGAATSPSVASTSRRSSSASPTRCRAPTAAALQA